MSEYTETDRERLTTEKVLELWSKTYNSEGKPDWSHIFPYYHPDIVFQDSIQRLEGIDSFKAMCARLTDRCTHLQMDIETIAGSGDQEYPQEILMDGK